MFSIWTLFLDVLDRFNLLLAAPPPPQMHGTGTPLGDPIVAGAAAAVLLDKEQSQSHGRSKGPVVSDPMTGWRDGGPLVFASDKSALGHTEPAAGRLEVGRQLEVYFQ